MKKLKIGVKSGLKYFNIKDIRSWKPCYDPAKHLKEDFRGTSLTILRNESIPAEDRLWVVLRTDICSKKTLRLFAVWCYRQTLVFLPNQDKRSIEAANVAERYANGLATKEDLEAAAAAYSAASYSASYSAASAASAKQLEKLIEMITLEGKERRKK